MKRPIPNSYWVEPGKLLAGEYPGGSGTAATRKRLQKFFDAGIRQFFDLTEPGELPGYRELLPEGVEYRNFPITDHSVPQDPQRMQETLEALRAAHAGEGGIYVHCRAGIGRTGMTIGCWLREQGVEASAALGQLNRLWKQNARSASWPTVPETDEQYHFVQRWRGRPDAAAAPVVAPAAPVLAPLPQAAAAADHAAAVTLDRVRGCLLGLALGDALAGAQEAGLADGPLRWGDDTAMTLCVAASLLARQGFDGRDQVERYLKWQRDPAASGADPAAALRPSVRTALLRSLRSHARFQGSLDPSVVDAAPLARSAAAALFVGGAEEAAGGLAADLARVTHQAPVVVDACKLYAALLRRALLGRDKPAVTKAASTLAGLPLKDEVLQVTAGWDAPPGGGRRPALPAILAALDRAVRAFIRTEDAGAGFARLQQASGTDLDATLAAYGALAGAWCGEAGLPRDLLVRLEGREWIEEVATSLHQQNRASGMKVP